MSAAPTPLEIANHCAALAEKWAHVVRERCGTDEPGLLYHRLKAQVEKSGALLSDGLAADMARKLGIDLHRQRTKTRVSGGTPRGAGVGVRLLSLDAPVSPADARPLGETVPATAEPPHRGALHMCLAQVPTVPRLVLESILIDGRTRENTARELGISVFEVATALRAGRKSFFAALAEHFPEWFVADFSAPPLSSLSFREREVFRLVSDGLNTAEIAHQLGISWHTVTRHRAEINRKLGTSNPAQVARLAMAVNASAA